MADKARAYEGENITVTYSLKRCIHAAECVHNLGAVFDPERRPWVDPDQASADQLADVIMKCPSGALQFKRKDDGAEEPVPEQNTVSIDPDGPIYLSGNIEVKLPDGSMHADTRVALCRCGASRNKPFCDNSHLEEGFKHDASFNQIAVRPERDGYAGTVLQVMPARNGPLLFQGPLVLVGPGKSVRGRQTALCRCGNSNNKPFCDGMHSRVGFSSEPGE